MISTANKEQLFQDLEKELEKIKKEVKKPNILIVGATGVGKSTIVNQVFGESIVDTGSGKPITRGVNKVDMANKPVNLYDTEGFEIGKDKEKRFQENVLEFLVGNNAKTFEEQIHLVWHVVSASSNRITDYDQKLHEKLKELNIPVALIFSKCDEVSESDLRPMLKEITPSISFETAYESDESPFLTTDNKEMVETDPNLSIMKVVNWSIKNLPKSLEFAFISAQMINIEAKKKRANSIVIQHSTSNAVIGMSPIPFSDAPLLIASQTGMVARILYVYEMGDSTAIVKDFMKSTGFSLVVSNLGKSLAGNLLKMIPIVGTAVGALINGSVASAITFGMGRATSEILYRLNKSVLNGEVEDANDILENFNEIFSELFKQFFNKKSEDGRI